MILITNYSIKHTRYLAGVNMKVSEGIRIELIGLISSIHSKALTFQEYAYLNFNSTNFIVFDLKDFHSNSSLLDAIAFAISNIECLIFKL